MEYVFHVILFLRISIIAQEIISNILFYEKKFLLNGGMTTKSAEMQDLLGIEFKEVRRRYEFVAKPAPVMTSDD